MNLLTSSVLCIGAVWFGAACAALEPYHTPQEELDAKWGHDWGFSGISTFAHLPHIRCLTHPGERFDIGIIGVPFDTAVSYRPGARFGPRSIRAASSRQTPLRGYNPRARINPYASWARLLDCGDMPITPFDNALALRQMTTGYTELLSRPGLHHAHPRLVTLGGDHSLALPALRGLSSIYGNGTITVVHFDAHLDTWSPFSYDSSWLDPSLDPEQQQSSFTHGSMFWLAWKEGLIARDGSNVHAGLRTRLTDEGDERSDGEQGWVRIASDEVDNVGVQGIVRRILEVVGREGPVYLSVDIDVLDPGLAPATGTPEPGGWLTRELIQILRGIEDLNVVGADLVEVSPGFDGAGEQTSLAAAQIVFEIITSMVKRGIKDGIGATDEVPADVGKDEL